MILASMPSRILELRVDKLTPVSTPEGGRNFFRAEARLDRPVESLQPGMEGVAKIATGHRSLIWIYGHGLVDSVRMALWSWLP